jgi:hypothetical protein
MEFVCTNVDACNMDVLDVRTLRPVFRISTVKRKSTFSDGNTTTITAFRTQAAGYAPVQIQLCQIEWHSMSDNVLRWNDERGKMSVDKFIDSSGVFERYACCDNSGIDHVRDLSSRY